MGGSTELKSVALPILQASKIKEEATLIVMWPLSENEVCDELNRVYLGVPISVAGLDPQLPLSQFGIGGGLGFAMKM